MAKGTGSANNIAWPLRLFITIGKPFYYLFLGSLYASIFGVAFFYRFIYKLPLKYIKNLSLRVSANKQKQRNLQTSVPSTTSTKPDRDEKPVKYPRYLLIAIFLALLSSTVFTYFSYTFLASLPSPDQLSEVNPALTTKIYDRDGRLLYKFYRSQNRTKVYLTDLPPYVADSTIAIEDKDFYYHNGLSTQGILRASFQYLTKGKKTGGSTITQQLIKNTLLTPERTYTRKIKEAILALLTEHRYSKNMILEMYLNQVGYGGSAYGIEEAAQKYFAKPARELKLSEAALLAGLIASPTRYSPLGTNPEIALERQKLVLDRMVEDKKITQSERQSALADTLTFAPTREDIRAPHFVMYLRDLITKKYDLRTLEEGGLEITTSLDLDVQDLAEKAVETEINQLAKFRISNGAALVTNPKTGEILAMVGSKNYFATDIDGNFNVTTALRQPGSSIKPVNYSIALDMGYTLATLIDDSPITYQVPGQPPYSPTNYDKKYHGKVPLKVALGSSYNIPAVKLLASYGVAKMIDRAELMGIATWADRSRFGLSLTLGGGEVKMTEMATIFGVFATSGTRVDLNPILEIKDAQGKILESNRHGTETPVLTPGTAFLINRALSDNSARTPAFGPNSQLYFPRDEVAVKTGTTQNMRDNWTIGYTPTRLVAVWVGNNDNTPMSYVASGITGASPIWRTIMEKLLENRLNEGFAQPENVIPVSICSSSFTLPCDNCPKIITEYFVKGTEPKYRCNPDSFSQPTGSPTSPGQIQ